MNKWLLKFMEQPDISDNTDISDRFELLDKKMENMHGEGPDKTDKFDPNVNMSVLSGRAPGLLGEKLDSMSEPNISDRFNPNLNMSGLSGRVPGLLEENFSPYDEYDFDERLSIAEYEGGQTPTQAQRIAYLDAFMAVLVTLPYNGMQGDWLTQRIRAAQAWLLNQSITQPK